MYEFGTSFNTKSQFQSYLYGIEIQGEGVEQYLLNRFNRTFMELKLFKERVKFINGIVFQSYLYGIEIRATIAARVWLRAVSIVPLWN